MDKETSLPKEDIVKLQNKSSLLLIILCWVVYTCSYIGKLGYNANIIQIEKLFNISHSESGMVSTLFFFSYGAGQIINGIFCKKYNIKYVVFCGLILSGIVNLVIGLTSNFTVVKVAWVINGGALSVLWTALVRLLAETLDKKQMGTAVVVMGTTVATGTFLVYGLSALFVAFKVFKLIFFIAGVILPTIALIWLFIINPLTNKIKKLSQEREESDEDVEETENGKVGKGFGGIGFLFAIFLAFAVMTNFVKDGLTTWVPTVLNETYSLPDYTSILMTLALPLCSIFGTWVAVKVNKKIRSFVSICGIMFFASAILIGLVISLLSKNAFVVTVISFALVSLLMAGVNNVVTSMMPLYWKDRVNSGMVSGVLNGFCYVGSTISSYGLGLVADFKGWNAVFLLLFTVCILASIISFAECFIRLIKRKNRTLKSKKTH